MFKRKITYVLLLGWFIANQATQTASEVSAPAVVVSEKDQAAAEHYLNLVKEFCLARQEMQKILIPFYLNMPKNELAPHRFVNKMAFLMFVGIEPCVCVIDKNKTATIFIENKNPLFIETLHEIAAYPEINAVIHRADFIQAKDVVIKAMALHYALKNPSCKTRVWQNMFASGLVTYTKDLERLVGEITQIQSEMNKHLGQELPAIARLVRSLSDLFD